MKKTKTQYTNRRGITLIALIITVIVLLILAGAAISSLNNGGGLINKAADTGKISKKEQVVEYSKLGIMNQLVKNDGKGVTDEELVYILKSYFNNDEVDAIEDFEDRTQTISSISGDFEIELSEIINDTTIIYTKPLVWSGDTAIAFEGGDGSEANPYIIKNGEQLAYLAQEVNNGNKYTDTYFSIIRNIDLNNIDFPIIGKGLPFVSGTNSNSTLWNYETYFDGNLDGTDHTLYNLKIWQENLMGAGLIGVLGENGTVCNLKISKTAEFAWDVTNYNYRIADADYDINARVYTGGFVGASRGKIINCHNIGVSVQSHGHFNGVYLAGSGCGTGGIVRTSSRRRGKKVQ